MSRHPASVAPRRRGPAGIPAVSLGPDVARDRFPISYPHILYSIYYLLQKIQTASQRILRSRAANAPSAPCLWGHVRRKPSSVTISRTGADSGRTDAADSTANSGCRSRKARTTLRSLPARWCRYRTRELPPASPVPRRSPECRSEAAPVRADPPVPASI